MVEFTNEYPVLLWLILGLIGMVLVYIFWVRDEMPASNIKVFITLAIFVAFGPITMLMGITLAMFSLFAYIDGDL